MRIKNWLECAAALAALAFGIPPAHAGLICTGCEYSNTGTYIGTYDPNDSDFGTFAHSDVALDVGAHTAFEDYWVFDLDPGGRGSISADFTRFTGISGFTAALYADGGSSCAGDNCLTVVLGSLLDTGVNSESRWEIITSLPAGRYVIKVTGTTNGNSTSAYTGQLAFVGEPGTLAMFGLGLLGMGLVLRRHRF